MNTATSTQPFNPYTFTPTALPPASPTGPTTLPTFMAPPNVSLTGPANNDEFNYTITNPATQQAVAQPLQNVSYPLNASNNLTGQGQGDFFISSTTGAPVNYTAPPLPAPFKPATFRPDVANQQIQLDLNALLNSQNQAVSATAPVAKNPFADSQTTTIPGYPGQPGNTFNMLA
jgi:hypothetical protein